MALTQERILLQALTAQAAGTVVGGWFDLSDFAEGAFYVEVTSVTGSLTVTLQESVDGTTAGQVSTGGNAPTISAISATGTTKAAVSAGNELAFVRCSSVVATGPVTANIYFVGNTR